MAIDTKSLTQIITGFRALQTNDAASPESLGYILQCIVDLLSTAGTSETVAELEKIQVIYADSLGLEFCRAISNALNPDIMRRVVTR